MARIDCVCQASSFKEIRPPLSVTCRPCPPVECICHRSHNKNTQNAARYFRAGQTFSSCRWDDGDGDGDGDCGCSSAAFSVLSSNCYCVFLLHFFFLFFLAAADCCFVSAPAATAQQTVNNNSNNKNNLCLLFYFVKQFISHSFCYKHKYIFNS